MGADFSGARADVVGLPTSFFDRDLPRIRDLAELKVLLTVYRLTADVPDRPFVQEAVVIEDDALNTGLRLRGSARAPEEEIRQGIELALAHDSLIRFWIGEAGSGELETRDAPGAAHGSYWLTASSPESRLKLAELQRGEITPPGALQRAGRVQLERPNVFRLFEQNVGLVTPLIADQLIEALEIYPEAWIAEAIDEAVGYNRRNWRYIQRILERWATEGRGDEADQRTATAATTLQSDKYLRGKYASLFRKR